MIYLSSNKKYMSEIPTWKNIEWAMDYITRYPSTNTCWKFDNKIFISHTYEDAKDEERLSNQLSADYGLDFEDIIFMNRKKKVFTSFSKWEDGNVIFHPNVRVRWKTMMETIQAATELQKVTQDRTSELLKWKLDKFEQVPTISEEEMEILWKEKKLASDENRPAKR